MTDVQQQTLSMSRVAQILGVSIQDVADATDTGELPHRNLNGQIFYLMRDVEQYLEQASRVGRS
jgi:hypothetical protein